MKLITYKFLLLAFAGLLYAPCAWSVEIADTAPADTYSWQVLKVIFSLILVLIVFYLLVNVFRKYMGISFNSTSSIRVIGGLSLGGKEKVVLIEAGQVNLLLGVSATGISKLHQFSADEFVAYHRDRQQDGVPLSSSSQSSSRSSFKNQVENLLKSRSP